MVDEAIGISFSSLRKYFSLEFVSLIGLTSEDDIFQNNVLTYIYSLSLALKYYKFISDCL